MIEPVHAAESNRADSAVEFAEAAQQLSHAILQLQQAIRRRTRDESANARMRRRQTHVKTLQGKLRSEQHLRARAVQVIDQAVAALEHYAQREKEGKDGTD